MDATLDGGVRPETGVRSALGLAKALSLLVPAASARRRLWLSNISAAWFPARCAGGSAGRTWRRVAFALVAVAGGGRLPDRGRSFVWLAALAILISGLIGVYHAGVEAEIFEGFTQCTSVDRRRLRRGPAGADHGGAAGPLR